jgi:hypothetical protein
MKTDPFSVSRCASVKFAVKWVTMLIIADVTGVKLVVTMERDTILSVTLQNAAARITSALFVERRDTSKTVAKSVKSVEDQDICKILAELAKSVIRLDTSLNNVIVKSCAVFATR